MTDEEIRKRFKFGDPSLPGHYICYYCGLAHKSVEAAGIWNCPNIACQGPGNRFRCKLSSYVREKDWHSVSPSEWYEKAKAELDKIEDAHILEAVKEGMKRLLNQKTADRFGV